MKKFEIGKTYYTRSACDHDCVFSFKVVARTEKTITLESIMWNDGAKKCRVIPHLSEENNAETLRPLGNYSMAPSVSANMDEVGKSHRYVEEVEAKEVEVCDSNFNVVKEGDTVIFYADADERLVTKKNRLELNMVMGIIESIKRHGDSTPTFIIKGIFGDVKSEVYPSQFVKNGGNNALLNDGSLNVAYTVKVGTMKNI